jgi:hypothetical protein
MDFQFESIGPTLRIVVLFFLILFALLALGVLVVIAALPGRIAKSRNHPQTAAINICGWLGLPTGLLWIVAMVWAFLKSGPIGLAQETVVAGSAQLKQEVLALESMVNDLEIKLKESRR